MRSAVVEVKCIKPQAALIGTRWSLWRLNIIKPMKLTRVENLEFAATSLLSLWGGGSRRSPLISCWTTLKILGNESAFWPCWSHLIGPWLDLHKTASSTHEYWQQVFLCHFVMPFRLKVCCFEMDFFNYIYLDETEHRKDDTIITFHLIKSLA